MPANRTACWTLLGLALLAAARAVGTAEEAPLFPFVISYDSPRNATNVSAWLERPAGKHGFVQSQAGRLTTAAGPIRFWATNFCFEACFPTHEQAERVAARLARLGINCVRMHHMDSRSIWGDSPNKLTIDPKQLDRLDYLIYQLKLHGVYTDLNLHVSRWFDEAEGFTARQQRPNYDKGLDNFEPRMIELQKKYARDLLGHVNPYTKTAYSDEPAVAFVEINNENALFAEWSGNKLDDLPDPYAATFRQLWNVWLRKKYPGSEKLRQAWKVGEWPLGDEMLRNGDFDKPLPAGWKLETDAQTKCTSSIEPGGPEGRRLLRLAVARQGEVAWHPQLTQSGLALKKGTAYTLSFSVRCDKKQQLGVNCTMAHDPWQRLGLSATVDAGPEWKQFQRTFVAESDDANVRITFSDLKLATYELAAVSLRPGGVVGLAKNQRLEDGTVPLLRHGQMSMTEAARGDFIDFLWDTERDYWWGMYRFLKDELKVRPLVSGTQLGYSPVYVQAGLDYIDAHAYWNHPHFPGRPWDSKNWTVRNVALVNTPGGTLAGLAARRVAGMAFTVSEYNHPEPNQYAAEGFPMIAAFAALQAWDGVFSFCYSSSTEFEPRKITGFFNVQSVTARLAHMPACAAMFLRGDVAAARQTVAAPLSPQVERAKLRESLSARKLTATDLGLDGRLSLVHGMALDIGRQGTEGRGQGTGRDGANASSGPLSLRERARVRGTREQSPRIAENPSGSAQGSGATAAPPAKDATEFVSDTAELRWDVSQKGAGFFIADTPRSKLFTGFVRGRTFTLGNVVLRIGRTRLDWATVSLVAVDGAGFDKPGRLLIAATGQVQNQGATLEQLSGENVTLGNKWGDEPILCEGIAAEVTLPVDSRRVRFFPLDEAGNRRAAIATTGANGQTSLKLDPQQKTVWYEVEIK